MDSRKRKQSQNNNEYSPKKQAQTDIRFVPEILADLGVGLLSDGDSSQDEEAHVYSSHDQVISDKFGEFGVALAVPVADVMYRRQSSDEPAQMTNPFTPLSDEIVMTILFYLNRKSLVALSQTCIRFNVLCRDEALWPRLNLTSRKLEVDSIGHVLTLGVKVLRLNSAVFPSPLLSPHLEITLSSFVAKVKYLDLSCAWIQTADLALLLSKMRCLLKLSLESLVVNENVMQQIGKNQELDTLNLAMARGLTCDCIKILTSQLCKLISLNLAWTGLDEISWPILCHNLTPRIEQLNISGAQLLKNEDAVNLVRRCRLLETLDISDCLALSVATFREIIKKSIHLRHLAISRCYQIETPVLSELSCLNMLETLAAYRLIPINQYEDVCSQLPAVRINEDPLSVVARPTVGIRRTSIWCHATIE